MSRTGMTGKREMDNRFLEHIMSMMKIRWIPVSRTGMTGKREMDNRFLGHIMSMMKIRWIPVLRTGMTGKKGTGMTKKRTLE
ncbi:hypothetical protein [Wolbachia endosymbiont (group A) of Pipizella viduata]|uniref:hypothetical protein n=1 Tax=Wolbachia endosymbiont (group A) of Pipizella viduata TaxID=3066154 RepID=UPI00333F71E9